MVVAFRNRFFFSPLMYPSAPHPLRLTPRPPPVRKAVRADAVCGLKGSRYSVAQSTPCQFYPQVRMFVLLCSPCLSQPSSFSFSPAFYVPRKSEERTSLRIFSFSLFHPVLCFLFFSPLLVSTGFSERVARLTSRIINTHSGDR